MNLGLGWLFLPPLLLNSDRIYKDIRGISFAGGVLAANSIRRYMNDQ